MKKIPFSYSTFPNIYRRARRKATRNNTSIAKVLHAFLESYVMDEPELPEDSVPIEYASLKARSTGRKTAEAVDGSEGEAGGDVVTSRQIQAEGTANLETILPEHETISESDPVSEGFSGSVSVSEDVIIGEPNIDGFARIDHFAPDRQTEATNTAAEVSLLAEGLEDLTEDDRISEVGSAPTTDIGGPFANVLEPARAGLKKKAALNGKQGAKAGKGDAIKGRASKAKPAKGKVTKVRKKVKPAK